MNESNNNLSYIGSKNTRPELAIRKELYSRGFRYNIHLKDLPGKPDIVLKKYKVVILINGCFWHAHKCNLFKIPKTNTDFWLKKFDGNRKRDSKNIKLLRNMGWRVCVVWECFLKKDAYKSTSKIVDKIENFINKKNKSFVESARYLPKFKF